MTFINLFCMFEYFNVSVYDVDQKQATEKAEMNLIFFTAQNFSYDIDIKKSTIPYIG